MKHINNIIGIAALSLALGLTSCTDYLDKTPDSDVNPETAFKNFTNFQGFVEEIYNCIPNKESCYWCTSFNWGEDEIMNTGGGDTHITAHFDLGDYRHWYDEQDKGGQQSWLNRPGSNPTSKDKFAHSLNGHAWYCVRKANLGLQNLDKMTDATKEEKDFIKGQLLFFRAWWHHQQMEWWGGIPYIDRQRIIVLLPTCCPTTGTTQPSVRRRLVRTISASRKFVPWVIWVRYCFGLHLR